MKFVRIGTDKFGVERTTFELVSFHKEWKDLDDEGRNPFWWDAGLPQHKKWCAKDFLTTVFYCLKNEIKVPNIKRI